jgi:pyruvate dehydrogenase (quinone)
VVLVMNNRDLNYVSWEMRAQAGEKRFAGSQDVPDFPYARFAEMCGLVGVRVEKPEEIGRAWDIALGADRPVVVDCLVDPEVPPLPPHITPKQAKDFLSAILDGDARAARFVKQTWKQVFPSKVGK